MHDDEGVGSTRGEVERQVQLSSDQRTMVWRQHHGYVKCKTCSFCAKQFHIDDMGIWSLGKYFDSRHTWYCSVQCANHYSWAYLKTLLRQDAARQMNRNRMAYKGTTVAK